VSALATLPTDRAVPCEAAGATERSSGPEQAPQERDCHQGADARSFRWPSAHELAARAMAAEKDAYEAALDIGREPDDAGGGES
jgi:hypothetical protein